MSVEPPLPADPPPRRSPLAFVAGIVVALVIAPTPATFLGMLFWQERSGTVFLACAAELAVFAGLLWLARRKGWTGFPQGLVVGGATVFLLSAACWGVMGGWR